MSKTSLTNAAKTSGCSLAPHPSIKGKVSIPITKIVKYDSKSPVINGKQAK